MVKRNIWRFQTQALVDDKIVCKAELLCAYTTRMKLSDSSSAIVHESAKIGKDVKIGPWTQIGEYVEIGDMCEIGSHVVLKVQQKLVCK